MFNPMMLINMMIQKNPMASKYWNLTQQMTNGKSPEEINQIIQNVAQQKGIDLNQAKQMYQQYLNNFMGGNHQ